MATSCEAEQHISHPTIDEQHARSLTRIALTQAGVPAADADKVADALVDTSLRGIDTHGLRLLPQYLDELATGIANAAARIRVIRDRGAGLLIDADGALGVLAGLTAARTVEILSALATNLGRPGPRAAVATNEEMVS